MTGISKRFSYVSSFMTAVALSLGLMVTGCSEGNDTPGNVNYDATNANIDVIVGLAEAEEAATEKGFDVPATATNYVCAMLGENENILSNSFAAEATEDASAYKKLDDDTILMQNVVNEVQAGQIDTVLVLAYDEEDNLLGSLCEENVAVTVGKTTTVDFTSDDAAAFMTKAQMIENTTLEVTTDPEIADGAEAVTIAVDETVTATVTAVAKVGENTTISEELDTDEFTMSCESEAVSIEGNVVTGVAPTEEAVEIGITVGDGSPLVTSFNVMVTGDTPVDPEISAIYLAPEGYDVNEDGTAIVDADGEEVAAEDLPTEQAIAAGESMTFVVIAEKAAEEEAVDAEEATVTYEAITDVEATLDTESENITNENLTVTVGEEATEEDTATLKAVYTASEESGDEDTTVEEEEAEALESNVITITVDAEEPTEEPTEPVEE